MPFKYNLEKLSALGWHLHAKGAPLCGHHDMRGLMFAYFAEELCYRIYRIMTMLDLSRNKKGYRHMPYKSMFVS